MCQINRQCLRIVILILSFHIWFVKGIYHLSFGIFYVHHRNWIMLNIWKNYGLIYQDCLQKEYNITQLYSISFLSAFIIPECVNEKVRNQCIKSKTVHLFFTISLSDKKKINKKFASKSVQSSCSYALVYEQNTSGTAYISMRYQSYSYSNTQLQLDCIDFGANLLFFH